MTPLTPGGTPGPATPLLSNVLPPLGIDGGRLRAAIAARRARIALIEAEWVATCERCAARNTGRGIHRVEDRETWDRAMWDRYLAAAVDTQPDFLPPLRRLYEEVRRLERLEAPPPASAGRAA